jgi:hypothetical protein
MHDINSEIPIEEYFRYHPPTTEERKQKHEKINVIALEFAKIVDSEISDPQTKQFAIFAIQQARMFANQGITVDDIKQKRYYENQ